MRSTAHATFPTGLKLRLAATVRRFAADRSASTAVEYAVMTLIAVAIVAAIAQLGGTVTGMYEQLTGLFGN